MTGTPSLTFDVCVVGSSNLDLVVTAPRHPKPGETLLGTAYHEYPGGKGLNQVVAAARAGAAARSSRRSATTTPVHGWPLSSTPRASTGPPCNGCAGTATGRALITVDASRRELDRRGAGRQRRAAARRPARRPVSCSAQLEIPVEVVADAFAQARAVGAVTILNPAPASRVG